MRNTIILLVALLGAVAIYTFSKESTSHIENYNIAVDHLKKNEYQEAIPYLEKAIESKPNEERILIALEEAYLKTGEKDKAKEIRSRIMK